MGDFRQIIDRLGSTALAEAFSLPASHVRVMKVRNSIPPEYWGQLIEVGQKAGELIDFASLMEIRSRRRERSAA